VVGEAQVRKLEAKVREFERLLGKKTMEVEILREALERTQVKKLTLRLMSPAQDGSR
jgi:transposase